MKLRGVIVALIMGLGVAGCASNDTATRNAVMDPTSVEGALPSELPAIKIVGYNVTVPQTLKASEANLYYPTGDIVWREDPMGNRHAQVKSIIEAAVQRAMPQSKGRPATLDIEVRRFHALSQKSRYSIGGKHDINLIITVRDAKTGAPIAGPNELHEKLVAFGGDKAILAESQGLTQKVRIVRRLSQLLLAEYSHVAVAEQLEPQMASLAK